MKLSSFNNALILFVTTPVNDQKLVKFQKKKSNWDTKFKVVGSKSFLKDEILSIYNRETKGLLGILEPWKFHDGIFS